MQFPPYYSKVLSYCTASVTAEPKTQWFNFIVKEEVGGLCVCKTHTQRKRHQNIFHVAFQEHRVHVSADLHYLCFAADNQDEED